MGWLREPLYKVESPYKLASATMEKAAGTFGRMQAGSKTTIEPPSKTAGGGIMAAAGGVSAGAMIGSAMAAEGAVGLAALGGPIPMAIGGAVLLGAYLFG